MDAVPRSPHHSPNSRLRLRVTGMTCAGCAASIQRALEARSDVESATVSFSTGLAEIAGPPECTAQWIQTIQDRGFVAEAIQATTSIDELSEIEKLQQKQERTWRHRAIVGIGLWLPLELLHWIATVFHFHGAWMPWVMFLGASIIMVFAGSEFYRSAWKAALHRTTNMDTLISLGATTAFVYSTFVLFFHLPYPVYFAEASGLLGIVSLGHWFEARASSRAGSAVRELMRMQPDDAEVILPDGSLQVITSREVKQGMRLLVRPGGRLAVDGRVVDGYSAVDESIVTGESMPVEKHPGDEVVAGAINTTGKLVIETTVDGDHTTIRRIASMVQKAQASRAPIQRLADYVSSIFVPTVIAIAILTVIGWWFSGNLSQGIIAAATVLIISCPCALGLATPMAIMVGTGSASRRGILIRNAETIERLGRSKHVVFDKTGTLTVGRPEVTVLSPNPPYSKERLLQLAASVEAPSEHPIARAIVRTAQQQGLALMPLEDFEAIPGKGVQGRWEGQSIVVERDEEATARVLLDGQVIGTLTLSDQLRPDASSAIAELKKLGLAVSMLSGDRRSAALAIANELGLAAEQVFAEATPEAKGAHLRALGNEAVMVGDGLNDAAALASAGLGVALASGTNVAMEAAAVVIPGDRVQAIPELFKLARATLRTIRQNLFFAFFYNALAIPVAALGLLGTSGPLWAALAMGFSDLTVVGNALWLKRKLDAGKDATRSPSKTRPPTA